MKYEILIKALQTIKQQFPDHDVRDISESGMITIIRKDSVDISNEMVDIMIDKNTGEIIDIYGWYAGIPKKTIKRKQLNGFRNNI